MADITSISGEYGSHKVAVNLKVPDSTPPGNRDNSPGCCSLLTVPFIQKIIAEMLGTYFLIFLRRWSIVANADMDKVVTLPGISIVWGLAVMVIIYTFGHIPGAHFNPAITIAFATRKRFPWKQVTPYIVAQVAGSTLANGTIRLSFNRRHHHFAGTLPSGNDVQALVVEFIITFYLMFVVSGVATDNRAIGELAGLAIGATVSINVLYAGLISGASMNPARSLGSAIESRECRGIWIYLVGPTTGAIAGAWAYNIIRFTDNPLCEITKCGSLFKRTRVTSI